VTDLGRRIAKLGEYAEDEELEEEPAEPEAPPAEVVDDEEE
jgi:hypothetical protein